MNVFKKILKLSGTGFTNGQYYESMNLALKRLNNEHTMLHYPYFVKETDSFIQAQQNLTDYCISLLKPLKDKEVLEIGCGNGVQAIYIYKKFNPSFITGIDLSKANIDIAYYEKERAQIQNIRFNIDNAQNLSTIPSESVDVLLNIESAFHYPDKTAFLQEVHRVLKPGGQFLIADLLCKKMKKAGFLKLWGKPMKHNFWDIARYDSELEKSELTVDYREDISHQVRKGWSMYRNWIPSIKRKAFLMNVAFRIFYVINVRINTYLLHNKQQYFIFVGHKPA